MATTLQGKLTPVRLSLDGGTTFSKVVCRKASTWTGTTQTSQENTECGVFTALGANGWSISIEFVTNVNPGAGEISSSAIKSAWSSQTRLVYREEVPDQGQASAGGQLHNEGFCYITSIDETNTVGQLISTKATLTGDGNTTFVI